MASRMLLNKMTKTHQKFPMQFLGNPTSVRPRPTSPIPQTESINEAPRLPFTQASSFTLLGTNQKLFRFPEESTFAGVRNNGFSLGGGGTVCARQYGRRRYQQGFGSSDSDDDYEEGDIETRDFKERYGENEEDWDDGDDVGDDEEEEEQDEYEEEEPKRKSYRRK